MSFKSLSDFVSRLATIFIMVFLARTLSQEQFGLFSYGLAAAMLWALLLDFGWNAVLVRKANQDDFRPLLLSTLVLKFFLLGFLACLIILVPSVVPKTLSKTIFLFCFLYAAAISFQDYQSAAIAGMERFDIDGVLKFIPRWTPLLLIFLFLRKNPTPETAAMVLGVSSLTLTALMIAWFFTKFTKAGKPLEKSHFVEILKAGAPFGLTALLWGGYTKLDVILLGQYEFPLDQIGIYAAAIKVVDFCRGLTLIVYLSLIPIFNDHGHDLKKLGSVVKKTAFGFIGLALLAVPVIYFTATPFMAHVYGVEYAAGGPPLILALGGVLLFLINTPFQAALVSLGRGRIALLGSGLMLLTCFTVNVLLLPGHGFMAPAWSIVVAEAMWLFVNVLFLARRLR